MTSNIRLVPDAVLIEIADYVVNYDIVSQRTMDSARLCMTDALACALDALDSGQCISLIGPIVPNIIVPGGARVPGTQHVLDPATAAFSLGCMIRWLGLSDWFSCAQGSHPSDNLAGILMLADYLSQQRVASGRKPLAILDVLNALVKAYEIQGCIAIDNDFSESDAGIDQTLLTRVASAAVLTHMLGGTFDQIVDAVSNAWIDTSLLVFRRAPNTGSRKSWAGADAVFQAMRLAFMVHKGEMGYSTVLSAKQYGFYDARFGGKSFKFQRPYGEYIIQNTIFRYVPGGMLGQSAVECAFKLHPVVVNRLDEIERVNIFTQHLLMKALNKTGPLHNWADRDHCVQYTVAVGLIYGQLHPQDLEDDFASDPRIDKLREKMEVTEEVRFSKDFLNPDKRSSANAIQIHFRDGSSTPRIEIEYPMGHPRRREDGLPALSEKVAASLKRRFAPGRCESILQLCNDGDRLTRTPVNQFLDLFVP